MCEHGIVVRPATPADLPVCQSLALRAFASVHESMALVLGPGLNAVIYPDWAQSQIEDVRDAWDRPGVEVYVAEGAAATPFGFVSVVVRSPDEGEIDMIAVDPGAQHKGVGAVLTDHAINHLRQAGCHVVSVATGGDRGHAAARALYESAGFTPLPLVRYYLEL